MDLSVEQIRWIFQGMIILIASITVHEFGHALVADRLGDGLPRSQGRVTLNPVSHVDPIGTLMLPLLGMIYTSSHGMGGGFGWGKPVQIRPERLSRRWSMETGHALVAIAGPSMNMLLGILITGVHVVLLFTGTIGDGDLSRTMVFAAGLNFTLFFFNLVPASPLDGGAVAARFVPYKWKGAYEQFSVYAPFVVMALVMISPLRVIFTGPANFVHENVFRGFAALAGLF
jgi:Zn-dependent protease